MLTGSESRRPCPSPVICPFHARYCLIRPFHCLLTIQNSLPDVCLLAGWLLFLYHCIIISDRTPSSCWLRLIFGLPQLILISQIITRKLISSFLISEDECVQFYANLQTYAESRMFCCRCATFNSFTEWKVSLSSFSDRWYHFRISAWYLYNILPAALHISGNISLLAIPQRDMLLPVATDMRNTCTKWKKCDRHITWLTRSAAAGVHSSRRTHSRTDQL